MLAKGEWLLEAGGEFSRGDGHSIGNVGQALLRRGFQGFEVRLHLNSLVLGHRSADPGLQDAGVSVKATVARREDGRQTLALLAGTSVPTGAAHLTADRLVPSATLLYDVSLGGLWSLSLNGGYALGPGPVDEVGSVIVTPAVAIPGTRWSGYLAYAGFFSATDRHYLESGLAVASSPDLQLDLNGGVELESGAYFLGAGLAVRWRHRAKTR